MLNVLQCKNGCDNGQYIFLGVVGSEVSSDGPVILDENGNLVWTSSYGPDWGLDVQILDEKPYLTFCTKSTLDISVTCHVVGDRSASSEVVY